MTSTGCHVHNRCCHCNLLKMHLFFSHIFSCFLLCWSWLRTLWEKLPGGYRCSTTLPDRELCVCTESDAQYAGEKSPAKRHSVRHLPKMVGLIQCKNDSSVLFARKRSQNTRNLHCLFFFNFKL